MRKTVAIVEDDPMCRRLIERHCSQLEAVEVVGVFERAEDALPFLEENRVDLLLLDVEMPGMSGLDLLAHLHQPPPVIFTTSRAEYAVDAFRFRAVDFLKKPVTLAALRSAVERAFEQAAQPSPAPARPDGIYLRENGKLVRLDPDSILFFENVGDYVRVKTATGSHLIHGTLKSVDERLADPRFLKVHRSYIVNLSKIVDVEEASLVIDKTVIPISRAHRAELLATMRVL